MVDQRNDPDYYRLVRTEVKMEKKSRESRKLATYSLIIMSLGFIGTIPFQGPLWVDLLQGAFEAGLVGGLADWFAVTALFRHPLGLRIPHTALLPNNRERVTNAIVKMLKNDLLSKESIQGKIKDTRFTEKLLELLREEMLKDGFKHNLIQLMKHLLHTIDVEKMTPFVKKQLEMAIANVDIKKYVPVVLAHILDEQVDQRALDFVLKKARSWLSKEQNIYQLGKVSMNVLNKIELDGFLQFALKSVQNLLNEEKLGQLIKNLLLSVVSSLEHEGEPNRRQVISYIRNEMIALNDNNEFLDGIDSWKNRLLTQWNPDDEISLALQQVKARLIERIEDEDFIDAYLIPVVNGILEKLNENSDEVDHWIQTQITGFIENNHSKIGDLVKENLDKLETETMIDMIENHVGKDLQWIRVNGAVCGFILGLILTSVHLLFS